MKQTLSLTSGLILATLTSLAMANDTPVNLGKLEIGAMDFPPYSIVKDGQEPSGCLIDYMKHVAKEGGIDAVVKGYPPKRLFTNIASGATNLWLGTRGVPEYEGKVLYGSKPVAEIKMTAYKLPGTPALTKKEDLAGKSVIVIYGFAYGGFIQYLKNPANQVRLQETNNHKSALLMLNNGRADYLLDYDQIIQQTLEQVGPMPLDEIPLQRIPITFVVSQASPNAEQILKRFEQAAKQLAQKGEDKYHLQCKGYLD